MIYTCGINHPDFNERPLGRIKQEMAKNPWGQLDTETTGTDPFTDQIIMLQLGNGVDQFVIDARTVDIILLKEFIENHKWILQSAKFDYKMLKQIKGIVIENIYDTMLAEQVLYCGYEDYGYGLADITKRYTGVDLDKGERASFIGHPIGKPFSSNQIRYGALDVTYLEQIKNKQKERAEDMELEYCINLENNAVKALADMELNGIILNKEKWLKLAEKTKEEVVIMEAELDKIVTTDAKLGPKYKPAYVQTNLFGFEEREIETNYGSPKQIQKILDTLGFKTEGTDERELTKIAKKHIFPEKLLELRGKKKIVSTYGEGFLNYIHPITNRVHTTFWQIKNTGRVASGSKDNNAPNMQNLPAKNEFRNCFEAPKGYKWVSIDYSGQELRIMADKSGEKGFIRVLNSGEDLHCYAGSMMFKRTITVEDKADRKKAKTINFGKPYGMGAPKLADMLNIPLSEAEELFKVYAKTFPTLEKWLNGLSKFAKRNGYSTTFPPCNRRRFYPEMERAKQLRKIVQHGDKAMWKEILMAEGATEREGGNSPIQGAGADIMKEALVEIRELIKHYNQKYGPNTVEFWLTVHDAADVIVREDLAEEFAEKMKKIMITCGNKYVTKVSMEVDVTITDYWQK